jgi:S-DNA-T family DNA segregation ATPase FtsK/SpoIIIE
MGRRKKEKENPLDYLTLPSLGLDPVITKTIWALFILVLAIVSALSLFESAGFIGVYLNTGLTWLFGWGRWLAPILLLVWSGFILLKEKLAVGMVNYVGLSLFAISLHGIMQLFINQDEWTYALKSGSGGGHFGWLIAWGLVSGLGLIASYVILLVIFLISLMFIFNSTLASLWSRSSWPAKLLMHPIHFLWQKITGKQEDGEAEAEEEAKEEVEEEKEEQGEEENEEEEEEEREETSNRRPIVAMGKNDEVENIWHPNNIKIDLPIELLNLSLGKPVGADTKNGQKVIQKTLEEFGINVEMGAIAVGPTVTQYTLRPSDGGIKLSRITNLNNDLAMALAAHPVRIEAPIPGKSLVGIEVPNKTIALVSLREILANDEFKNRKTNNTIALGKDVAGKVWVADITKMPHLLVAGATGSGKSVMLNTIIVSLLYQNNPDDLRFIMVDPKRVELTIYNGIPHLLTPVITEVSKTVNALKWSLNEMDRRFKLLAKAGKRDIVSFNQSSKQKMPYIIFVIDELADLMLLAGKEVEAGIVRLAQMSRAVGIHLILATQRPSVNVITGTIKANMPARIAFAVASSIDSRTILDGMGAEKLLGRGDMLFSDASMPKPKRLQGSFVGEKEIKKIVAEIKRQGGGVEYIDDVTERQKVSGMAGAGMNGPASSDDDDELVSEAKEIVINAGKASATLLQRKLSVGYARAAKLLDILEEHGIIGPSQGSKPREILVSKEEFSALRQESMSGMPLHKREESRPPASFLTEDESEEEESEDEDDNEDETAYVDSFEKLEDEEENKEPDEIEEIEELEVSEDEIEEESEEKPKKIKTTSTKDDYDFDKYFSR